MSYQPVVCQYDGTGCGHILQAGDSEEIGFLASPRSSNEDVFALVRLARAAFHSDQGPGLSRPLRFANEDCKARGNFCSTRPWFQATGEWRAEGSSLDAAVPVAEGSGGSGA